MKNILVGRALVAYTADYTLQLQFSDDYFVRIETPFTLELPGNRIALSPENDSPESFEPIAAIVGHSITEWAVDDDGALRITFGDSARFVIEPDADYESWTVSGPDGMLVVCTPGGELAVWQSTSESVDGTPQ